MLGVCVTDQAMRRLPMATRYARTLINAIRRLVRFQIGGRNQRALLIVMLSPFMPVRSLNEAAQFSGVSKNLVGEVLGVRHPSTALMHLRRNGERRLIAHLRRLAHADPSVRSRQAVTLCIDDCTRRVRGDMGGLAHPCYSGADKKTVFGLNIEELVAVIGDGLEVIVLDVRVMLPRHDGPGQQRETLGEWAIAALARINTAVQRAGLDLRESYLSVDSAYANGDMGKAAEALGLHLVSEIRATWIVTGPLGLSLPSNVYLWLYDRVHAADFKPLRGDPGTTYFRHHVDSRVFGQIVVVTFHFPDEIKHLFTPYTDMMSITMRRAAKRRWQIERTFWDLKQLLGLKMIHQQIRSRVLIRIYLAFMHWQAIKDCATEFGITVDAYAKVLRHDPQAVLAEIRLSSEFVPDLNPSAASVEEIAASRET
ncbi:MAG: hypothetical protein C0390_13190 [Syntrophus sp. (in: bacteria)]|nr:hypothetical protein [Syntrophus sp. (in: bacteria)]